MQSFVVTDGSMCELIRPALYSAYHRIELAAPSEPEGREATFDVVGPVCESADFLGKDRSLLTPSEGSRLVVFDCGAYASAMALGSYNLRLPCAEFWVAEGRVFCTRESQTLEQYLAVFPLQPRPLGAVSGSREQHEPIRL
jgi:diaminopimelate decarboxylase